jgi:hypothetical protein
MSVALQESSTSHGGILLPLDMFRPTMLAAVLSEGLVGKARNIVDARLLLTRHPIIQLLLVRIQGSVVGDDVAGFWRENADLALMASHAVPRQLFMYYAAPGPGDGRREGFVVAQRGQVLAADEASAATMPADASDQDWPVARLCSQIRVDVRDLAAGFAGGPQVELALVEPDGDDQAMLMTLAGAGEGATAGADPGSAGPAGSSPAPAKPSAREIGEADLKRREREQHEEAVAARKRAKEVAAALEFFIDDDGVIVAPRVELSETEILTPLVVAEIKGDLPAGLPQDLTAELQGKRMDFVVPVDFLSEVLVDNVPLSREVFEEGAKEVSLGNSSVRILEALAPRLGHGSLVVTNKAKLFVSRRPGMKLPERFLLKLLERNASP